MGGIFAVRALEEESVIGGGFFCSPLSPVETNVPENFGKICTSSAEDSRQIRRKEINEKASCLTAR